MTAGEVVVSVVMPAFNVARFVEEAVLSIRGQSFSRFELIAVDDGSTDGTASLLERLAEDWPAGPSALRVLRRRNGGAAAARNAGLDAARGEFIAFLDADDRWRPEALERLTDRLRRDPALDLVFPLFNYVREDGAPLGIVSRPPTGRCGLAELLVDNPIHSATGVLLRRAAVERVGRFDESLTACIDLDYWLRVAALRPGNLACVAEVLADYRRRDGQITSDWRRMERNWTRVLDAARSAAPALVAPIAREARARHCLYWGTIAYTSGDYAAARRLAAEAWTKAPLTMARSGEARLRGLACLASLLPARWHDGLRDRFHAACARLGLGPS